jgi:hypothetical protein
MQIFLFLLPLLLAALLIFQAVSAAEVTGVTAAGALSKTLSCSPSNPPVATFAWAQISAASFQTDTPPSVGLQCTTACANFRLGTVKAQPAVNVTGATRYLCRFVNDNNMYSYGTWIPAQSSSGQSKCRAYVGNGTYSQPSSKGFDCGCCGTINKVGQPYSTGCNLVTRYVPKNSPCPEGTVWTPPAGAQICRAKLRNAVAGAAQVFGTITPQSPSSPPAQCKAGWRTASDWERLCYQINTYSGPPSPGCRKLLHF